MRNHYGRWWEAPLYALLLFAAGSLVAIAIVGWHTYKDIGGTVAVVLVFFCGFYVLQSLWAGAVTRR